jgi:hypothetical protein
MTSDMSTARRQSLWETVTLEAGAWPEPDDPSASQLELHFMGKYLETPHVTRCSQIYSWPMNTPRLVDPRVLHVLASRKNVPLMVCPVAGRQRSSSIAAPVSRGMCMFNIPYVFPIREHFVRF